MNHKDEGKDMNTRSKPPLHGPEDNYGYTSVEERHRKRGLENWEMVEAIPDAQKPVPKWFIAVIVAVIFVSISLSFPFFGRRTDVAFDWTHWSLGIVAAVVWIVVGSIFIYCMTRLYGSKIGGRLDHDPENKGRHGEK